MCRQSLYNILSNELNRRLEVLNDQLENEEIISVVDKFIQQLVNSEFSWHQCREIVVIALTGHTRKEERRKKAGRPKYRSGCESLESRVERKLTEKYNWFRKKRKEDEKEENKLGVKEERKSSAQVVKQERKEDDMPKSVLFVQHTINSGLAKELRKVVNELKPWTNIGIKVVERSGERIQDILHKSDPWESRDCGREDCAPCLSSSKSEKLPYKNCTKRSVVYKTWCETCRAGKVVKEKMIQKIVKPWRKKKKE